MRYYLERFVRKAAAVVPFPLGEYIEGEERDGRAEEKEKENTFVACHQNIGVLLEVLAEHVAQRMVFLFECKV